VGPITAPDIVLVLTTAPDSQEAETLARALVDERLAACVNVHGPMTSYYRWRGSVERDAERQLVIKTTRARVAALQARLASMHPYELPECLVVEAPGGSDAYRRWVADSVEPASAPGASGLSGVGHVSDPSASEGPQHREPPHEQQQEDERGQVEMPFERPANRSPE
jgi:periplasmic divalent cation tolerance protein